MTEYIIETRIHATLKGDEEAKGFIAFLLGLYKLGVDEGDLKITDIEMGLLRDGNPVELPLDNIHLLQPKED
jgi:hypothetical protein